MGWVAGYDVTWPHSFGKELLRRFEKQRLWGPVPAEGTGQWPAGETSPPGLWSPSVAGEGCSLSPAGITAHHLRKTMPARTA